MTSDKVIDAPRLYWGYEGGSITGLLPGATDRTLDPWPTQCRIGGMMSGASTGNVRNFLGTVSDCALYEGDIGASARTALLTYAPSRTADVGVTPLMYKSLYGSLNNAEDIGGITLTNNGSTTHNANDGPAITRTSAASALPLFMAHYS